MKRIGILGGTFNPIHVGHLAMAKMAQEKFGLDKVIFIPSYLPPHKKIINLASAHDRLRMVQLAIADNPAFDVSDMEIKRKGKSYTIDTLRNLRKAFAPEVEFFLIVGGDTFADLKTWKKIDEILSLATLIVVNRPGHRLNRSITHYSVTMPGIDISSSYVRRRVTEGKTIQYFIPGKVIRYIHQHNLYKK